jgi:hypothetical protein
MGVKKITSMIAATALTDAPFTAQLTPVTTTMLMASTSQRIHRQEEGSALLPDQILLHLLPDQWVARFVVHLSEVQTVDFWSKSLRHPTHWMAISQSKLLPVLLGSQHQAVDGIWRAHLERRGALDGPRSLRMKSAVISPG